MILKLALRNLFGAGIRTWLNVLVLSLSYVLIVWTQGLYQGMGSHATRRMINSELGGGQYWRAGYDPFDPLSLQKAHGKIPEPLKGLISGKEATPILIAQGAIYPGGRFRSVLLKGIDPLQKILDIPSESLGNQEESLPLLLGSRMAKKCNLKLGDTLTLRWRDRHGAFDAREALVVRIMNTDVQSIDNGQLWLPLETLRKMTGMAGEATTIVLKKGMDSFPEAPGWAPKKLPFLLKDIREMVKTKKIGAIFIYAILLFLALLSIFNSQALAIFRRRREIGTLVALGMTRGAVVRLFTVEGGFHGILAALVGAVYGVPLLALSSVYGLTMPQSTDDFGVALGKTLYPEYSVALVVGTTLLVFMAALIVSYIPAKKISGMEPTDALRGRVS